MSVAQSYGYSEAHGKEICDPLPPSTHIVAFNGYRSPNTGVNNDDANQNDKLIAYVKKQDGTYEEYGEYTNVFGAVLSQVKENRVYLQAHWGSGVKFSNIEFSELANE